MTAPMQSPTMGQPPQPPLQPPQPPWNPFLPRPNDSEPSIAMRWARRLSRLMSSTEFDNMQKKSAAWAAPLIEKYQSSIQAITPPPVIPKGVIINAKADTAADLASDEQAAASGKPQPSQPQQPTKPTLPRHQQAGGAT